MRKPFDGDYPITRGFIANDPSMPRSLWDPIFGPTHRGIDWALPNGTPLCAAVSGVVTYAQFSPDGAGNCVVIRSGSMLVKCFHMSSIDVSFGQNIAEGQPIGASGSTGNAFGPHLHFQVENPAGKAVDPLPLITGGGETSMPTQAPVRDGSDYNAIAPEGFVQDFYRNILGREPESPSVLQNRTYGELYAAGSTELRVDLVKTQEQVKELVGTLSGARAAGQLSDEKAQQLIDALRAVLKD